MRKTKKEFNWGPVSDIMSGLMIVFLFIAVSFMRNQQEQAKRSTKDRVEIYAALTNKLQPLIENNIITINETNLAIRFVDTNIVYFQNNQSKTLPEFQKKHSALQPRLQS